jgi:hypothetical protein
MVGEQRFLGGLRRGQFRLSHRCWGYNSHGQVGNGLVEPDGPGVLSPLALPISHAVSVACGDLHSCAVLLDWTTQCWGSEETLLPPSQGSVLTPTDVLKGMGGADKTFFVQCVRGNPSYGINVFVDNGDQTVTDKATGLTWSKSDSGSAMDYQAALAWVQSRNTEGFLGHDDWRMPNAKELQSIVDYTRSPNTSLSAAIDPLFDAQRGVNYVRLVRGGAAPGQLDAGTPPEATTPPQEGGPGDGASEAGPKSCSTQADCEVAGACPSTLGCTCTATPDGMRCVPKCKIDADCPKPSNQTLVCGPDGLCVPQ